MFFGMTAWLFFRRKGRLSTIVASLMVLLGAQSLISQAFIFGEIYLNEYYGTIMTCIDVVAVPMYGLILRELVRPFTVTWRVAMANVFPFVVIALLYCAGVKYAYWLLIAGVFVYGTSYLIWTHINIGIYNQKLKEQFSFTDHINLGWLRKILWFFFVLMSVWVLDTVMVHEYMDCVYLLVSVTIWMIIDYFLYKHKEVMDSLNAHTPETADADADQAPLSDLGRRIDRLFAEEKIFLNPNLKISDVAVAVGSNRTYVSAYFNREASTSFYDYVNGLRIEYACHYLINSDDSVKLIAEKSGYNSSQSFIRVFTKIKGVSPSQYRSSAGCD